MAQREFLGVTEQLDRAALSVRIEQVLGIPVLHVHGDAPAVLDEMLGGPDGNLRVDDRQVGGKAAGDWDTWFRHIVDVFPVLGERVDQTAGSLSGGEQQMLSVCRALAGDPKVIMFDELSMGLAPIIVGMLFDRVAALREEGRTIVLVEQYLTHALKLADLVYVLQKGTVAWSGTPNELRKSKAANELLSA